MKFDELRSIAHDIADSLASGNGFLVGVYTMDIFGEARRSSEGFIAVDFLTGTSKGGKPSSDLEEAIWLYKDALIELCGKHGASPSAFKELSARYSSDMSGLISGWRYLVTVADHQGHRSVDEYVGAPGTRPKVLDSRGRIRRQTGVRPK
jgi:hypothetical protein